MRQLAFCTSEPINSIRERQNEERRDEQLRWRGKDGARQPAQELNGNHDESEHDPGEHHDEEKGVRVDPLGRSQVRRFHHAPHAHPAQRIELQHEQSVIDREDSHDAEHLWTAPERQQEKTCTKYKRRDGSPSGRRVKRSANCELGYFGTR